MKKQNLPLSPHLQIYKPQITSVLSIMHRITGFSLTFIIILLIFGLLTVAIGERYYNTFILYLTSYPLKLIFFPVVYGLSYHMLNGIRHILWDFGLLISNRQATISGILIIALSILVSTYILYFLGIIL